MIESFQSRYSFVWVQHQHLSDEVFSIVTDHVFVAFKLSSFDIIENFLQIISGEWEISTQELE